MGRSGNALIRTSYQSREEALAKNLVSIDEFNRVKLGVDSVNTYTTKDAGRPSVRITSNDDFTHGLFIADFAHMPTSTCGIWYDILSLLYPLLAKI
jgi:hypothetical protein